MAKMRFFYQKLAFTTAIVALIWGLSLPSQLQAHIGISGSKVSDNIKVAFNPPPPPDDGVPSGRQKGAGSHSSCEVASTNETNSSQTSSLIALVPEFKNKGKVIVWGQTISEKPQFMFYVAYSSSNTKGEFILEDKDRKQFDKVDVKLPQKPGIISVSLSPNKRLEVGKRYHWYFKIKCNAKQDDIDDLVKGSIDYLSPNQVNPTLENRLKNASPSDSFSLYDENGIWYDALNTLADLVAKNPEDSTLKNKWNSLLKVAKVESVANEKLCLAKNNDCQ